MFVSNDTKCNHIRSQLFCRYNGLSLGNAGGWRVGSVLYSTCCSSKRSKFYSIEANTPHAANILSTQAAIEMQCDIFISQRNLNSNERKSLPSEEGQFKIQIT